MVDTADKGILIVIEQGFSLKWVTEITHDADQVGDILMEPFRRFGKGMKIGPYLREVNEIFAEKTGGYFRRRGTEFLDNGHEYRHNEYRKIAEFIDHQYQFPGWNPHGIWAVDVTHGTAKRISAEQIRINYFGEPAKRQTCTCPR
jgi:hypothetical protein